MAHPTLDRCPNCGGDLQITRLSCTSCETVILARYESCAFCHLKPDSLSFVQAFIKNRGNLKEMERELGQSYWTLRARLNEIIEELGFEVEAVEEERDRAAQRRQILTRLESGEINAAEAASLLAQIKASAH